MNSPCLVLELADHNDLRVTTGYKILGIAKKWDTSKEPHSIIDQINVDLILGEEFAFLIIRRKM